MISTASRRLLIGLVIAGILLMVAYVAWHLSSRSIEGTYRVADSVLDSVGVEQTSVLFVEVEAYDSMHALRVAEALTRQQIEQQTLNVQRRRTYVYHFYVPGDSASLTPEMIDELSYKHPSMTNPEDQLYLVPHGWIVRAIIPAKHWQPESVEAKPVAFYMPRAGLRARDVQ